ncbi:amino acid adenylation domain-containing protein [Niabella insulamsoli]|uniref:amino acid adenylation domain-containing protein n=1 Tax=Niabella insulamsoli TaxID=3144874 RepID=UPI0031FCED64
MSTLDRDSFVHQQTSILGYFLDAVQKYPEATALHYKGASLTYRALDEKSAAFARYLIASGVKPDDIVAICLEKGFDVIISIIAILKAGAAYMPVDPAYPKDRVAFMLEDAKPQIIISAAGHQHLFGANASVITDIDAAISQATAPALNSFPEPARFAYVLFTSGSTGRPKGVLMRQAALVNLIKWQLGDSQMTKGSKTINFSPITFDVSFQEIFTTLAIGGTLYLIDDTLRLDAASLLNFLEANGINRLFLPFVALQMLCEAADAEKVFPQSLKEVMTAGEQLKVTPQIVSFFAAIPGLQLFNQYGPTEGHVVTSLELSGDPKKWPELPTIGRPIDNVSIYILDNGMEVPDGTTGELCIGGIALAEGYMNQDQLTAEKFVSWDHNGKTERIYKTGDLAKYLPDGTIDFLGRMDEQVKIRGYRVELGEIETALLQNKRITNCVVMAQGAGSGDKRIIAYLVGKGDQKETEAVRSSLLQQLPDYMIPSVFEWIDELPKTASGKVDKKALSAIKVKRPALSVLYRKPKSAMEKNIASVWSELLLIDEIGTDDNFFELGGNSVLAQKSIIALKQKYGYNIPITRLYQYPTIKGLQSSLDDTAPKTRKNIKKKEKAATGDIAIIGLSGRFPGAETIEAFWDVLKEGKETISFFKEEEIDPAVPDLQKNDPLYVRARGVLKNVAYFDAELFGINPKLAELMDPQMRVFLEISREVLEKTGYLAGGDTGVVGVFAGSNTNTYFNNNVFNHKDKIETQGYYQTLSVSEKDYLSTRVAYHLNLKGPAVNVNTACSTSLMAIAQAVESLRMGQCELAIAGGVALNVPVNSGHVYEEGAMFSNDGHCRPFDADAKGTVFSDGAGVVLLKRLSDAQADNDLIYAVIKGVGVNNDGGGKGSFTAPSTDGQSEAILMAIEDAGVDPATISYVETHGTATPLGDPIEIEGLKTAFGEQAKKQYCAIGSVKSNIGHLTHAAGVAGVIKTALSLHHEKLVPSLHYKTPNPAIDFAGSPFVVNDSYRAWEPIDGKRIAGVSSFGIGGTNVHIVMEAASQEKRSSAVKSNDPQLVVWSSRSHQSNLNFAKKLSEFLENNTNANLDSVAYNLQHFREPLSVRTALVANDVKDLQRQLKEDSIVQAATRQLQERNPNIVFVFPGQGSQYVNMGRILYETEAVYRAAVDECAAILEQEINEDIRQVIFTDPSDAAAERLKNTFYTQPATFITSYALAKYYMSKGIQPTALVGHSIGEFVCAHLAGVLTLPDAIKLVAARARLISELPGGTMLSVRTSKNEVLPMLPPTLSVATNNAPNLCVVSGKQEDVEAFSGLLTSKGIVNKPLRTSHAFHSQMMDPIIQPLFEVAATFQLGVPRIPILSTVTADWLKDSEATDPGYWSQHARAMVNFSDAIAKLNSELSPVFLETGPGNATSTLIKQQGGNIVGRVLNSIELKEGSEDANAARKAIGKLWTLGVDIDWKLFHGTNTYDILHELPTYAYDRKKYWVEPLNAVIDVAAPGEAAQEQSGLGDSDLPRKERILLKIKNLLHEASGNDLSDTNPHLSFVELGFDSLLLTQVASSFKREFKVPVTFRQLNETYDTIDKLATHIEASLPVDAYSPERKKADQPKQTHPGAATAPNDPTALLETILKQISLLTEQVAQLQQQQTISSHPANGQQNDKPSLPQPKAYISVNTNPPVPGARLGKDRSGNPAWFVPDGDTPGSYLQIAI